MNLRCLAHLLFSVGKSVGRVAHLAPFTFTPFASNWSDRSIIIRLQISLRYSMDKTLIRFIELSNMMHQYTNLNVFAIVLAAVSHLNT